MGKHFKVSSDIVQSSIIFQLNIHFLSVPFFAAIISIYRWSDWSKNEKKIWDLKLSALIWIDFSAIQLCSHRKRIEDYGVHLDLSWAAINCLVCDILALN